MSVYDFDNRLYTLSHPKCLSENISQTKEAGSRICRAGVIWPGERLGGEAAVGPPVQRGHCAGLLLVGILLFCKDNQGKAHDCALRVLPFVGMQKGFAMKAIHGMFLLATSDAGHAEKDRATRVGSLDLRGWAGELREGGGKEADSRS